MRTYAESLAQAITVNRSWLRMPRSRSTRARIIAENRAWIAMIRREADRTIARLSGV